MSSADFSLHCSMQRHSFKCKTRSPRVMHKPFLLITVAFTTNVFRISIGLKRILPPHPHIAALYALHVLRCSILPIGFLQILSYPRHPCPQLVVPLIGSTKVFHLLGLRPAGRTKKRKAVKPSFHDPGPVLSKPIFESYDRAYW